MVDLMAGPNAPLTKAFIFCGWRTITVDWLIDASHALSFREALFSICQLVFLAPTLLEASFGSPFF